MRNGLGFTCEDRRAAAECLNHASPRAVAAAMGVSPTCVARWGRDGGGPRPPSPLPEIEPDKLVWPVDVDGRTRIWTVNPYRRCTHRCRYCIAGTQGPSRVYRAPDAILPPLRAALRAVPRRRELFVGALADAYPPVERWLRLTRRVLRELARLSRPVCVFTKSDLICLDIDLLASHPVHCDVHVSLCTLDEATARTLEPGAPAVGARLAAVRRLHAAGIRVRVSAEPWMPGVTDVREIVNQLPRGVEVQCGPLSVEHTGGRIALLGRRYDTAQIRRAYGRERRALRSLEGVSWK